MEGRVKVSIIVPCFNRVDRTVECWDALQKTLPAAFLAEIIFVDNGSSDGTAAFLADLKTNSSVVVLTNGENAGFAQANNQAAKQARGDFLVFLNNDTIPAKGWLEPLLELLASDGKIGLVGSKLIYPDGRVQHAGIIIRERVPGKDQLVCDHIHRLSRHDAPWVNVEREYQAVTGACLAVRRETFEQLGGFDEAFQNGYEDIDLCFRAREAGLRVIYCPHSLVVHHESSSQGRFTNDDRNTTLFSDRWRARIASDENETYAASHRPNLEEMRAELDALRQSIAKLEQPRDEKEPGAVRKTILRWLGLAKSHRQLATDVRTIRNALVHLRRVTESMALQLDHHEMSAAPKEDRADQSLL